jgi:hypothetical protein
MIAFRFTKERAEHFVDALANGKDIKCLATGWTQGDMLALAGAVYAVAFSQGPPLHQDDDLLKTRPAEHREMIGSQFRDDLFGAIELYEELTFKVIDAEYDGVFEPVVEGFVEKVVDKTTVKPGKGFPGIV